MKTLRLGRALLRADSILSIEDGRPVTIGFDEAFASLLVSVGAHVATVLAEVFPEPAHVLGLDDKELFVLTPSTTAVHEHFSNLLLDYQHAVHSLKTIGTGEDLLQKRNASAVLIQAYCSLAYMAQKLAPVDLYEEEAFVAVEYLACTATDAPYVSRQEWDRYQEDMRRAIEEEARLPLEVRLGLDGDRRELPTKVVERRRPRCTTALKAFLPWVGAFLPPRIKPDLYAAACALSADLSFREEGLCWFLTHQCHWNISVNLDIFADGKVVAQQLTFPEEEYRCNEFAVTTPSGKFRTQTYVAKGHRIAILRPLPSSMPDMSRLGLDFLNARHEETHEPK